MLDDITRHEIAPIVCVSADALRERFQLARPFPHSVVDDFLEPQLARDLLEQFPVARRQGQANTDGSRLKVVHSDLATLGPAYRRLHDFFSSQHFLTWVSNATGIDDLIYDPSNYGGGAHESLAGRSAIPHIDSNFHPVTKLHRRVNLTLYLNDVWHEDWGGNVTLYSDPRDPRRQSVRYEPLFNRCIIFETSDRSWHGFGRIHFPQSQKHRTRKSLSIYLYSRERPDNEIHAAHTAFFVPQPLPTHFRAGRMLTEDDTQKLELAIGERDRLIALYQGEQGRQDDDSVQAARLRILVADLLAKSRLPIMGYVFLEGDVNGLYDDGWSAHELQFRVRVERPVRSLRTRVLVPQGVRPGTTIGLEVGGMPLIQARALPGQVEIVSAVHLDAHATAHVRLRTTATVNHKSLGLSVDERDLGFRLESAIFEHQ